LRGTIVWKMKRGREISKGILSSTPRRRGPSGKEEGEKYSYLALSKQRGSMGKGGQSSPRRTFSFAVCCWSRVGGEIKKSVDPPCPKKKKSRFENWPSCWRAGKGRSCEKGKFTALKGRKGLQVSSSPIESWKKKPPQKGKLPH